MALAFKKATKSQSKARVAIIGPSGSGKTYTTLLLATVLANALGKRVGVIDSERGSASKYAGTVDKLTGITLDFDVLELESHSPEAYVQAIHLAEQSGFGAIVVDSLSHAWMGKDGALEQVDKAAKRSQSGNSFTAWRDVTPKHNALVDALTMCKAHLLVTMRSKTEYVLEEDARGKKTPRKIGLAPIQRDGLEYEFDVVGDMNLEHDYVISKTRCAELDGAVINKPGRKLAETLLAWLQDGVPAPVAPPSADQPCFSKTAKWAFADEWAGKPLADAPSHVLKAYADAIQAALDKRPAANVRAGLERMQSATFAALAAAAVKEERATNAATDAAIGDDEPDEPGRDDFEADDPAGEHAA